MSLRASVLLLLVCWAGNGLASDEIESNDIPDSSARSISSGDQLVSTVILECFDGEDPVNTCVRRKVLTYLNSLVPSKRSMEEAAPATDEEMDSMIADRVERYINAHEFKVRLPESFFQGAVLKFRPAKSLSDFDLEFPEEPKNENRSSGEARDMMKKNMLLPLLMMIKLKLKTLIPIFLAIVHVKATKALLLSKLALLLVGGFLAFQLFQKKNMMMMMPMEATPPPPGMAYGPPSPTYGPPSSTVSSYEAPIYEAPNSWEPSPSNGGPYARVWDAQSMAYNGYLNQQQTTNQQGNSQA